jgi:hypothetical protein
MMAASGPADLRHALGSAMGGGDDNLHAAARKILQSSGYSALAALQCEVTEAAIVVHGVLPSYYLKQMAQVVISRLDGVRAVTNLVEVRNPGQALT